MVHELGWMHAFGSRVSRNKYHKNNQVLENQYNTQTITKQAWHAASSLTILIAALSHSYLEFSIQNSS